MPFWVLRQVQQLKCTQDSQQPRPGPPPETGHVVCQGGNHLVCVGVLGHTFWSQTCFVQIPVSFRACNVLLCASNSHISCQQCWRVCVYLTVLVCSEGGLFFSNVPGEGSSCARAWDLQLLVQFWFWELVLPSPKTCAWTCRRGWIVCSDKFPISVSSRWLWGFAARLGLCLLEELELLSFAFSLLLHLGMIHRLLQGLYKAACVFYSIIPKIWPLGNHYCVVCQARAQKEVCLVLCS